MKPFSGTIKSPVVITNKKKKELEIWLSYKAKQEATLLIKWPSEFFGALDFLVTFLAMKKVTRRLLEQRDQKFSPRMQPPGA